MKIRNLQDLRVFVLAADTGSLSTAAHRLELSPAVASSSLKRLESDLGLVLRLRSTRSLRLSPEGQRLLPAARSALAGLSDALKEIAHVRSSLREELRISMPSDLGRNHVLGWLDEFIAGCPDVTLRVQVSDRTADIYRQPVDLAIRYGATADSGLLAVSLLLDNKRVLCASPDYLARCGAPASPEELTMHNCLCYRLSDNVYNRWQFTRDDNTVTIPVSGNRTSDDGDAVRR